MIYGENTRYQQSDEFGPEIRGFKLDPEQLPARLEIMRLYETATRTAQALRTPNTRFTPEDADTAISQLGAVAGLTVLSRPSFVADYDFRCAEWIFGGVCEEPWAQDIPFGDTLPEFWSDPVVFLQKQNYRFITQPRLGALIAYGGRLADGKPWLEHFGIYDGLSPDGKEYAFSKFGQGPIVHHPIDLPSAYWGTHFFFLEKRFE